MEGIAEEEMRLRQLFLSFKKQEMVKAVLAPLNIYYLPTQTLQ